MLPDCASRGAETRVTRSLKPEKVTLGTRGSLHSSFSPSRHSGPWPHDFQCERKRPVPLAALVILSARAKMSFWIPESTLGSSTLLSTCPEHAALIITEFLTCLATENLR